MADIIFIPDRYLDVAEKISILLSERYLHNHFQPICCNSDILSGDMVTCIEKVESRIEKEMEVFANGALAAFTMKEPFEF
jgi:hypothetical protein